VTELENMVQHLASERQELTEQRQRKLKQVTHLAEMVADLRLQLESLVQQDQYKTQLYGRQACPYTLYTIPDVKRLSCVLST